MTASLRPRRRLLRFLACRRLSLLASSSSTSRYSSHASFDVFNHPSLLARAILPRVVSAASPHLRPNHTIVSLAVSRHGI
ncbi:uncharacterized protein BKA78DRAFT_319550 [Phyllosticta capitalensis]|uniref:uncharacterized protein n=1 Tax=Phyllosticta capitalensis TaxID=121624 RepID=UPI003131EC27